MQTVVVLGGLAALTVHLGSTTVLDALARLDTATLLGALGIGALTTAASAGRWCLVARALGAPLPPRRAVADVYRATLLNSLLPAGVLGDLQRVVTHGRLGGRAVVLERVAGQTVVVVGAAALLVVAPPPDLLTGAASAAGIVLALIVVLTAVAVRLLTSRRAARLRASVLGLVRQVRRAVLTRATAPGVVGLSLVGLAGHLALFVLAARAAGATLPTVALVGVLVPALLAMSVPLTVAGFGPREAVAAATFAGVGSGAATGLATGLVFGVLALVSCLPGALVLVADLRLARDHVVEPGALTVPGRRGSAGHPPATHVTTASTSVKTACGGRQRRVNAPTDETPRAQRGPVAPGSDRAPGPGGSDVADIGYAAVVIVGFALLLLTVRGLDRL